MNDKIKFSDFYNGLQNPMRILIHGIQVDQLPSTDLRQKIENTVKDLRKVSKHFMTLNIPQGAQHGESDDEEISIRNFNAYFQATSVDLSILNTLADLLENEGVIGFMDAEQRPTENAQAARQLYEVLSHG